MHTNRLSKETSPYLLQHAHNPVDWYPWGDEAFERAEREQKPILVSIGYSTCHWCHVMERESFENEAIAAYMNEHFINIKVDREERPDVDQIYMDAVKALIRSGGWPLNCFLTPDKKPFFGGTYYPPQQVSNRPSWQQVLENIHQIFTEQREEVEAQAEQLVAYIQESEGTFINNIEGLQAEDAFTPILLDDIYNSIQDRFDTKSGGFGGPPKFPSTMTIQYLLNYYHFKKEKIALEHAQLSLDKMIMGGIYDQIGGGIARYATDNEWLIPHFEKMLYDNALLVSTLSDAYKITQKTLYLETIEETLTFIHQEMMHPEGGFYSAQDADSEGVEGKFYVWSASEINELLGEDGALFNEFYNVSEGGNWESNNILWRLQDADAFCSERDLSVDFFKNKMKSCRAKLYKTRSKRIKPSLDDKMLLDWNALMTTAYAKAYAATKKIEYKEAAERNISFLLKYFQKEGAAFYHTFKDGKAQYNAFLSDYAYLIEALLEVYFINFNLLYLDKASELAAYVVDNFYDKKSKLFFFANESQADLIIRKKETYDSATPSGNSTMAYNLQRLGILIGNEAYKNIARDMLLNVVSTVKKYPTSFARWATAIANEVHGTYEIAVLGDDARIWASTINEWFIPNKVIMATEEKNENYPLLADKIVLPDTMVYVCQDYACKIPMKDLTAVKKILYHSLI